MIDNTRFRAYDAQQLEMVLDGMARRLAALLPDDRDIVLIGILRRGVPLAGMLVERLHGLGIRRIQRVALKVKRYADDLSLLHPETLLSENAEQSAVEWPGKVVVVVDDVLYRGHSLLRVAQHLAQRGVAELRSVILVDRGVGLLPIRADVTGVRLSLPEGSIVEVHVPPYEPDFCIDLLRAVPR
ncbi:MAG: phosphoribosyltransferase [Candidatus Accumulibacter sp.]|uniref:phosphoribosyltransferase family protein n=1 Tax=Accumulibacter sp. TaxID=2053492 RepID=UPI001A540FB4|nr:phosphoribosyltransferase family protein [Accumulibacter sp.]MBL8394338.1 phosphoribosyltransferase [Accumulibacter sp.]